jgi:hypothetical protein
MTTSNSSTTATPRPWETSAVADTEGDQWDICAAGAGDMIADLRGCGTSQQQEANAGFIVKAVNAHDALVSALQKQMNEHGHLFACGRQTPPDAARPCRPACEAARAALNLAEGEVA